MIRKVRGKVGIKKRAWERGWEFPYGISELLSRNYCLPNEPRKMADEGVDGLVIVR